MYKYEQSPIWDVTKVKIFENYLTNPREKTQTTVLKIR